MFKKPQMDDMNVKENGLNNKILLIYILLILLFSTLIFLM
jgi:hypothetical protein